MLLKPKKFLFVLETACQMNQTRLMPDRPFHMTLLRAKVYPVKDLLPDCDSRCTKPFLYPVFVNEIVPKYAILHSISTNDFKNFLIVLRMYFKTIYQK